MRSIPANRSAALAGAVTACVTGLATLLGAIHSDTAKAVVLSVALVVVGGIVVVFLLGHQKYEERVSAMARSAASLIQAERAQKAPLAASAASRDDEVVDDEPGDGDGLPHLPTTVSVPAPDGDDSRHGQEVIA